MRWVLSHRWRTCLLACYVAMGAGVVVVSRRIVCEDTKIIGSNVIESLFFLKPQIRTSAYNTPLPHNAT